MSNQSILPKKVIFNALNISFPEEILVEELNTTRQKSSTITTDVHGWVSRIKVSIRKALNTVLEHGQEMLEKAKTDLFDILEKVQGEAGDRFPKVAVQVLKSLHEFEDNLLQGALEARSRPRILDDREFHITSFTITEKIILTTNLEVSITRLLKFAATGELSFTLQYDAVSNNEL